MSSKDHLKKTGEAAPAFVHTGLTTRTQTWQELEQGTKKFKRVTSETTKSIDLQRKRGALLLQMYTVQSGSLDSSQSWPGNKRTS